MIDMNTDMHYRPARREDATELFRMMCELADHEGDLAHLRTDAERLLADGFDARPRFAAVLAEAADGALTGFVSFTWHYAIWSGDIHLHIDDVYVRAAWRGRGVGEGLMRRVRAVADQEGATQVRWEAKPHNETAIRFYKRLGARMRLKVVFFWPAAVRSAALASKPSP